MTELTSLWLPILVAAVGVYIASFVSWMLLPFHHREWGGVPDEAGFIEMLRRMNIPAGMYCFPHCDDMSKMKDPEYKKRMSEPPMGILQLWPGRRSMPVCMLGTFAVQLITSVFVGYLAAQALRPGAGFTDVFQVAGAAGVLGYTFAGIPNGVWFGKPLRSILLDAADGVAYGLVTGLAFALLWPTGPDASGTIPGVG